MEARLLAYAGLEICHFKKLKQNFPAHYHNHALVGALFKGVRRLILGNKTLIVDKRHLVFIEAGAIHACEQIGADACDWVCAQIEPSFLKRLHLPTPSASRVIQSPALARQLTSLAAGATKSEFKVLESILTQSLAARPIWSGRPQAPGRADFPAWMHEELTGRITHDEMAQMAKMSKYAYLRAFSSKFGITPGRFLEARRLASALECLRAGASIIDAALAGGYYDQSHFHKSFKKYLGFTPGYFQRARKISHWV